MFKASSSALLCHCLNIYKFVDGYLVYVFTWWRMDRRRMIHILPPFLRRQISRHRSQFRCKKKRKNSASTVNREGKGVCVVIPNLYTVGHLWCTEQIPHIQSVYQQTHIFLFLEGSFARIYCLWLCTDPVKFLLSLLKGSLTWDFQAQVFFMNQCPPGP